MRLDADIDLDYPAFPPGQVWLAGAGPGDPRLLTLLALHALQHADEIVYDALVDSRILVLAGKAALLTFAGKRGGKPSAEQHDINEILIASARSGRRVLRLKGGDPFVFGRGGEEALALASAGIPFRIIPGVTAGLAAAALAGIPATMRETNHAVVLAAGHRKAEGDPAGDWEALGRLGQPLILYMPIAQLPEITVSLQRGGLAPDTPVALIHAATTADERLLVTTLADAVADAERDGIGPPAILVVGKIARLRPELLKTMVR